MNERKFTGILRGIPTAAAKHFGVSHTYVNMITNKESTLSERELEIYLWVVNETKRRIESAKTAKKPDLDKLINEAKNLKLNK